MLWVRGVVRGEAEQKVMIDFGVRARTQGRNLRGVWEAVKFGLLRVNSDPNPLRLVSAAWPENERVARAEVYFKLEPGQHREAASGFSSEPESFLAHPSTWAIRVLLASSIGIPSTCTKGNQSPAGPPQT